MIKRCVDIDKGVEVPSIQSTKENDELLEKQERKRNSRSRVLNLSTRDPDKFDPPPALSTIQ
jgi:hypothetical protein